MRQVAVADVGTNSTHLLIAQGAPGAVLGFRVLTSLKTRTRLGECLDADRNVTDEGYARLRDTLRHFRVLAAAQGIPQLRAYATSAMRDAPNGEDVAEHLGREVGVRPQIISGEREGQLTYRGAALTCAAAGVPFGTDNVLLDLGGGSLELARGGPAAADRVVSVPLGAVRLNTQFLVNTQFLAGQGEPPPAQALAALKAHALGVLSPVLAPFHIGPHTRVFGSSGTFLTLAAVLHARPGSPEDMNGLGLDAGALGTLTHHLARLKVQDRARLPGLDAARADIILAGAVVLHTALEALGVQHVTVSAGALREGMVQEALEEATPSPKPPPPDKQRARGRR